MRWQERLFHQYFGVGILPTAVQVPTGLGKTAVMALWLIARASGAKLPRRLVYVVDRRAVVDQATEFAEKLRTNLDKPECAELKNALGLVSKLPISTLRGQFVDNRDWLEDPSGTSIIVGTVDMVGSRLLFEGYGIGRKMRPYHAGLLGADALVLLDEAHLVPPFEALLAHIDGQAADFAPHYAVNQLIVPRFRMLPLSATGRTDPAQAFALETQDFDDPMRDAEVRKRLNALKKLKKMPDIGALVSPDDPETGDASESKANEAVKDKKPNVAALADPLAEQAWAISNDGKDAVRVLVYCNSREVAQKIEVRLTTLAKTVKNAIEVELFVGARRVRERNDAAKKLVKMGFLAGADEPRTQPVFLIATSAGEVGVDLDADHMVCDLVAWERMVQRFGRVNRRGEKGATIHVIGIATKPLKLEVLERAIEPIAVEKPKTLGKNASAEDKKLFSERQSAHNDYVKKKKAHESTVGKNLEIDAENKKLALEYRLAIAPKKALEALGPNASPLAILELNQRAASNPALKQWLIDASTPAPLRPALTRALVDAWSMTSLAEHTGRPNVEPWLRGWINDEPQTTLLWRKYLPVRVKPEPKKKELDAFFNAVPPHASELLETETRHVVTWLVKRGTEIRKQEPDNTIVGMLLANDSTFERTLRLYDIPLKDTKDDTQKITRQLANTTLVLDARFAGLNSGLLDEKCISAAQSADDGDRWMEQSDDGAKAPIIPFRIRTDDSSEAGFAGEPSGWRESLRFAVEQNADGEATRSLIIEKWGTASRPAVGPNQYLDEHQSWAELHAHKIADRLGFTDVLEPYQEMLCVSAFLHDEGKQLEQWQRAFRAPLDGKIYAKTRGPINQALLDGYRHEFGSLPHAKANPRFQAMTPELQDLALHLIVAHHGYGRPVIVTRGGTDAPSVLQERAREVALRFARLQKRWGPWGLAWWESLLRAADQKASRENEESARKQGNK